MKCKANTCHFVCVCTNNHKYDIKYEGLLEPQIVFEEAPDQTNEAIPLMLPIVKKIFANIKLFRKFIRVLKVDT